MATAVITVLTGAAIWLFGRKANHIGASGVIAGYFGYVLAIAYQAPSFTTIFLAGIALYYFGGILLSFIPSEEKVSWEGHLFGLISGAITPYILTSGLLF